MSILRLLDDNGYIASGSIRFDGKELTTLPLSDMYHIRGNAISVIFQEPIDVYKRQALPSCWSRSASCSSPCRRRWSAISWAT